MKHCLHTVEGVRAVWLAPEVELPIVGESFHAATLRVMVAECTRILLKVERQITDSEADRMLRERVAWLVPEPQNPHDRNAVAVWINGGEVGHMGRRHAEVWQPELLRLSSWYQASVACRALLKGKRKVGVWLEVPLDSPQPRGG